MFYVELGRYDFRTRHVEQIYTHARAVVEAVKKGGEKKPILRRLNLKKTSSKCLSCDSMLYYSGCVFAEDGDVVACTNLYSKPTSQVFGDVPKRPQGL